MEYFQVVPENRVRIMKSVRMPYHIIGGHNQSSSLPVLGGQGQRPLPVGPIVSHSGVSDR